MVDWSLSLDEISGNVDLSDDSDNYKLCHFLLKQSTVDSRKSIDES